MASASGHEPDQSLMRLALHERRVASKARATTCHCWWCSLNKSRNFAQVTPFDERVGGSRNDRTARRNSTAKMASAMVTRGGALAEADSTVSWLLETETRREDPYIRADMPSTRSRTERGRKRSSSAPT